MKEGLLQQTAGSGGGGGGHVQKAPLRLYSQRFWLAFVFCCCEWWLASVRGARCLTVGVGRAYQPSRRGMGTLLQRPFLTPHFGLRRHCRGAHPVSHVELLFTVREATALDHRFVNARLSLHRSHPASS
jgi:hypothetical protein